MNGINTEKTKLDLETKIKEYLKTLDNKSKEDRYDTERNLAKHELDNFYKWFFAMDEAKAVRFKLYKELRKEFETVPPSFRPQGIA